MVTAQCDSERHLEMNPKVLFSLEWLTHIENILLPSFDISSESLQGGKCSMRLQTKHKWHLALPTLYNGPIVKLTKSSFDCVLGWTVIRPHRKRGLGWEEEGGVFWFLRKTHPMTSPTFCFHTKGETTTATTATRVASYCCGTLKQQQQQQQKNYVKGSAFLGEESRN